MKHWAHLGVMSRPSQRTILEATHGCSTELGPNEQVVRVHYGEDGPGVEIERTRAFSIDDQEFSGEYQQWYYIEMMDLWTSGD